MSRTTILLADPSGRMRDAAEFENAFLGAMMVWTAFGVRYLGLEEGWCPLFRMADLKRVWLLQHDPRVPFADRVTLATTFDNVAVRAADLLRLVECLRSTAQWLPEHCHVAAQAEFLAGKSGDPGVRAVGWQQTSVATDAWWVPSSGSGAGRPYNIFRDKGHWWLFDEVLPEPEEVRDGR